MEWKKIRSENDLNDLISQSYHQPSVIFKHSTTCSISSMAKMRFENKWDQINKAVNYYFLDLHAHRPLSDKIAEQLKVKHESPQLIMLKDGKAVYTTSHFDISAEALKEELDSQYV